MKSRLLIAAVAFLGYAIIDGQAASAADTPRYYINTTQDAWNTAANWDSVGCTVSANPGAPDGDDSIIICRNTTVTMVANYSAPTVRVEKDGVLNTSTYILTVSSSAGLDIDPCISGCTLPGQLKVSGVAGEVKLTGGGNHRIDGDILLEVDDARLRVITSDATLGGVSPFAGKVKGQHDEAEILVDGVTMTSLINIEGRMLITDGASTGTFLNHGKVIANIVNGTLDINPTDVDDDNLDSVDNERWQVTASGAMLRFKKEPDGGFDLQGRFAVTEGTLRAGIDGPADDIDVDSTGCLRHTDGIIFAGENDSFMFCPSVR